MEKSIENIWKKGIESFSDIKAPAVANIYNRKSIHIMDKIVRRIKFNIYFLVALGVLFPIYCYFMGGPIWVCAGIFLLFIVPAIYTHYEAKEMKKVSLSEDSYHFLLNLRNWIRSMRKKNEKFVKFFYPINIILSACLVWFTKGRRELTEYFIEKYNPEITSTVVALGFWGFVAILCILMIIYAKKIYKIDVNLMYGKLFSTLNELIDDLEEMRKPVA